VNVLRTLTWKNMSDAERSAFCARGLDEIFDPSLRESISRLIDDVKAHGDEAVCRALATFDGVTLTPSQLTIDPEAIASARVEPGLEAALIDAIDHLRAFNDHLMERASAWSIEIEPGLFAGEKISPISSAGLFVPSGKASYPSVAYQLGVPAVVAGVPDIALVVPPKPGANGDVDPAVVASSASIASTAPTDQPASPLSASAPNPLPPYARSSVPAAPPSPAPRSRCNVME
jgi:histidinol dehydrogenase